MLKEQVVNGYSRDRGNENDEGDNLTTWEKITSALYKTFRKHKYLFTLFACVLGISIPLAYFYNVDLGHLRPNYGKCRINETYRMQVGINLRGAGYENLDSCVANFGCWDSNDTLPHKCYHSIPSTYQYFYKTVEASSDLIIATIQPATGLSSLLNDTLFYFYWEAKDVLSLELRPANSMATFPDPEPFPWMDSVYEKYSISPAPGPTMVTPDDFFYVAVKRVNGSDIFDTRYAPLGIASNRLIIGSSLPSRYFHGIKGGEGFLNFGDETVDGLVGFEKNELPFYMAYHNDGTCHGVLIETEKAFVAQFIKGPAVQFEFQGDFTRSSIAVKLFLGPKPSDVLQQLRNYILAKNEGLPSAPPSTISNLGVHFCRRSVNGAETLLHLKALNDSKIPYDSDCISENLRTPFDINEGGFGGKDLEDICTILAQEEREIMLTQKLHHPPYADETQTNETFIVEYFRRNYTIYQGSINREAMNYFSVFSAAGRKHIIEQLGKLPMICSNANVTAISLVDNFPKTDFLNLTNAATRIEAGFANSNTWDLLNPRAIHKNVSGSGLEVYHLDVVNAYGHESMKLVLEALPGKRVSTASQWTDSSVYGSFRGIQVPFTWAGFRDALAHFLRYFMFNPTSGIPVCGSNANQGKYNVSDDLLCMRWFQAALLLPHVHHTLPRWIYNESKVERAAGFNGIYEQHLRDSILDRYTLLPYYATLISQYESEETSNSEPPITPIAYQFPQETENFYIMDQFMIGRGLMAAPMVEKGTMRSVYFPSGTWYTFRGEKISSKRNKGENKFVVALANYTPLFVREGYIVPVLERPSENIKTARQAILQGSYSILAPYPISAGTGESTVGSMRIKDEGFSLDADFAMTRNSLTFNVTCKNWTGTSPLQMSSAKIFGFPTPFPRTFTLETETESPVDIPVENIRINEETNILIISYNTNWCEAGKLGINGKFSWAL